MQENQILQLFLQAFQSQDGNTEGENTGGVDTEIEGEDKGTGGTGGETYAELCRSGKLNGKWAGRDWGNLNLNCSADNNVLKFEGDYSGTFGEDLGDVFFDIFSDPEEPLHPSEPVLGNGTWGETERGVRREGNLTNVKFEITTNNGETIATLEGMWSVTDPGKHRDGSGSFLWQIDMGGRSINVNEAAPRIERPRQEQ